MQKAFSGIHPFTGKDADDKLIGMDEGKGTITADNAIIFDNYDKYEK